MEKRQAEHVTPKLMERLKEETSAAHSKLEVQPFFRALAGGELSLADYGRYLGQLLRVHEALESALNELLDNDPSLRSVVRRWHFRSVPLRADLAALRLLPPAASGAATGLCRRLAACCSVPECLGALYVLEGSRLGGAILSRRLGEVYGIDADSGLGYFGGQLDLLSARWLEFKAAMNALDLNAESQELAAEAARATFEGLAQLAESLDPSIPVQGALCA